MHTRLRLILGAVVVVLLLAGTAEAIRKGRLIGRVVDPGGEPIEGVTVTATSPDVSDFNEVMVTDDKGVFKVDFDTIDVTYDYVFEKAGYQTVRASQVWSLEGTERHDFVMPPGEAPTVEGPVAATSSARAVAAYNAGVAAFEQRDLATASSRFAEAVELDPEFRQAWAALSVVLLELAEYQETVTAAEKAIALGSTDEGALRARWEAYRQLGDEAKAAAALEELEAVGRATEEAKRIYNEGVALLKADDAAGAFASFQEAVAIDPNLEEALLAVAKTGIEIGRAADAMAAAETVLANDPGQEEAIRLRYNAALKTDDEALIADALVDLAAVEPEVARNGLWLLSVEAYNANDIPRAKQRLQQYLGIDPDHAAANYYLGLLYLNEGDNAAAARYLKRFVELAPDDPEAANAQEILEYLKVS